MRILATINDDPLRVVDFDIFEFSNRSKPIVIINRDSQISHIRIEIRYIHQFYEKLPNFLDDGNRHDLLLNFSDNKPPLKVHSCLLALYSPSMGMFF